MAAKSSIKLGQKVSFKNGSVVCKGTVKKLNPKTARVACPGVGTFDVSYALIKTSGRKAAKKPAARKGTRTSASAKAKSAALLRKLEREWEKHEERYGASPSFNRTMRSNPAKRRRKASPKRNSQGQFVSARRKRR